MATKKVYDECARSNRINGIRSCRTGSFKPNLKALFGVKELVNKLQFKNCSEAEKRRHLYEDKVIRLLYIESYPNR